MHACTHTHPTKEKVMCIIIYELTEDWIAAHLTNSHSATLLRTFTLHVAVTFMDGHTNFIRDRALSASLCNT